VIGAEIDQAGVGRNVIDAIGSDLAECGNLEVMNAYGLRIAFGPQLTTTILEIADQLVSRPVETHHQPLAELCMKLSLHTAPIRQTRRSCRGASVRAGRRES